MSDLSRTRPYRLAIVALFALVAGLLVGTSALTPGRSDAAHAAVATGTISGTVKGATTSGSSAALGSVTVQLYDSDENSSATKTTGSNGTFQFTGLQPGAYYLDFEPQSGDLHVGAYYGDAQDFPGSPVTVTANTTTTASITLALGGAVKGTFVGDKAGGGTQPLADAYVYLNTVDFAGCEIGCFLSATTDAAGNYEIDGIPAGTTYSIEAQPGSGDNHVAVYYGNTTQSPGNTVTVAGGQTLSGVNFDAPLGGSVSGVVKGATSSGGSAPLGPVSIEVMTADGTWVDNGYSDDDGSYTLTGLPPGTYYLEFTPDNGDAHVPGYLGGGGYPGQSVTITAGGAVTGKSVTLPLGATVTGTIRVGSAAAPANTEVALQSTAYQCERDCWFYAETDSAGAYAVQGVPSGTYSVAAYSPEGSKALTTYYGGGTASPGQTLTVTAPNTVTNINITMQLGASISGTVKGAVNGGTASGLSDAEVIAELVSPHDGYVPDGDAQTSASGAYTLGALPAGTYEVHVVPSDGAHLQTYNGDTLTGPGTLVTVASGANATANITAQLGATVSGTVLGGTSAGGTAPLSGATVTLVPTDLPCNTAACAAPPPVQTASNGSYTIGGINPGQYTLKVSAADSTHVASYLGAGTSGDGAAFTVAAAQVLSGQNLTLPLGASVSGTVKGYAAGSTSTQTPLAGATVALLNTNANCAADCYYSAQTDSSGNFTLAGVPAGSYTASAAAADGKHAMTYAGNAVVSPGNTLSLTPGKSATQNFLDVWATGGAVSGVVDGPKPGGGTEHLAGVTVSLSSATTGYTAIASTVADGSYSFANVPAGDYTLQFFSGDSAHVGAYYGGALDGPGAPVTVTRGAVATANQTLALGGSVSGVVTAAGIPMANAALELVSTSQQCPGAACAFFADSAKDGSYTVKDVPAGTYTLYAGAEGYATTYYGGGMTAPGNALTVSAGGVTSGANIALATGFTMSGTVTGAASGGGAAVPLAGVSVDLWNTSTQCAAYCYGYATTDASGHWSVSGVGNGDYSVQFSTGTGASRQYASEYYGGATSSPGTTVTIDNANRTGIDATLLLGGTVSGIVSGAKAGGGATALEDASVYLTSTDASGNSTNYSAETAPDGSYSITGVVPGTYTIEYDGPYNYDGQFASSYLSLFGPGGNATTGPGSGITVTGGAASVQSAKLPLGGTIAGTATVPSGGIAIYAHPHGSTDIAAVQVLSASKASYSLHGLAAGSYDIELVNGTVEYWYSSQGGALTQAGATAVAVSAGATKSIDITAPSASSLSGSVADSSGQAQQYGTVVAYLSSGASDAYSNLVQQTAIQPDGTFSFKKLFPGSYKLGYTTALSSGYSLADAASYLGLATDKNGALSASAAPQVSSWGAVAQPSFASADVVTLANANKVGVIGKLGSTSTPPAAPTVAAISPSSGPAGGGTTVTVTGTGFTGATRVSFGSATGSGLRVVSPTSLTVTSPPGSGTADVTVTTPGGTSAVNAADRFGYVPAPVVTGETPAEGPATGGTLVTVTGTGLAGATGVRFGSATGSVVTVSSDGKSLTATSPAGSVGAVDVTVTTAGGTSAVSAADRFTYFAPKDFSDVSQSTQYYQEIQWLASTGITTGYPDGSFLPVASVNRDAMAAFLYRFAGSPSFTPPVVSPFTDVATDNQFYKQITWLASAGITTGYDNGDGTKSYHPLDPVHRDAMAAFLYRFAGSPAFTPPTTSPFSDVTPQTQYFKEMTWLASTGITTGYDNGNGTKSYHPLDSVERDAMAAFLYRYSNDGLPSPFSSRK